MTYVYLQMAADSVVKAAEMDCNFGRALDGDLFYVEESRGRGGGFCIKEHRVGLAAEIIAYMKSRPGDYENYLLGLIQNPNFLQLDPGARGRIMEDCYGVKF